MSHHAIPTDPSSKRPIRSIAVIGGGTAGYFAALALKRAFPSTRFTLIESSAIPIIGVGEATTPLTPLFLHAQLGIDPVELFNEVAPTFKLGLKLDWGLGGDYFFTYPFGNTQPFEAYAHEGSLDHQSLSAMLIANERAPLIREESGEIVSLMPYLKFAYNLDNASFVRFLTRVGARAGIEHLDATIAEPRLSPDGRRIESLVLSDGRSLDFDFYVDASGFASLLIGGAFKSPFIDFSSSLFCDTAIVGPMPHGGEVSPYTQAESMDSGWCWRIATQAEDHRGYVFSSAHVSLEEAEREMRRKNPRLGRTRVVRFTAGRHRDFWQGNVAAVGNSYGFVEPLESTALHIVIMQLEYMIAGFSGPDDGERFIETANERIGGNWDYLRWFLAMHYKFNKRIESPFWRDCRAETDVSGIADLLAEYAERGPFEMRDGRFSPQHDPTFSYQGLMILLLGQGAPCPRPVAALSAERWSALVHERRALVARALPQAEALVALRQNPELLSDWARSSSSWIQGEAMNLAASHGAPPGMPTTDGQHDRSPGRYEHLIHGR